MLDITLNGHSIESEPSVYQRGKGIIVDSGTTDTYLPKSVANGFSKAWQATTGNVRHAMRPLYSLKGVIVDLVVQPRFFAVMARQKGLAEHVHDVSGKGRGRIQTICFRCLSRSRYTVVASVRLLTKKRIVSGFGVVVVDILAA